MEPRKHQDWVIHIIRSLEEEFESNDDETSVAVSIFNVPKTLISSKPEAYVPHMVAIGPYNHGRLELFEMDRYKLVSVKRKLKKLRRAYSKFYDLVNQFGEQDAVIRACYHRFLDFDHVTLSWMFAIDAAFLLEYLQLYARRKDGLHFTRVSSTMTHLIDHTRRKYAHRAILRDIIMLENQIPLFLIKEVHMFYNYESEKDSDEEFVMMLLGFCKDLSPLRIRDNQLLREECLSKSHLLDLLYAAVTPESFQTGARIEEKDHQKGKRANNDELHKEMSCLVKRFKSVLAFIFFIYSTIIGFLGRILKSKLVDVICNLLKKSFRVKTKPIEKLIKSTQDASEEAENVFNTKYQTPSIEEIDIPSVTELSRIGVKFFPINGGLESIKFDKNRGEFYLPVVYLDDNSDVVLRNLVAYEASIAPETMIITRYIELMNGLVDTAEDVKGLREAGIISSRLKSDKEVANLWNGMTLSVGMTKVPVLDKAIESVNEYYSSLWKVKMKMKMKKYMLNSWPWLTFLGANLLILLSAVEAFCSFRTCSNWLSRL